MIRRAVAAFSRYRPWVLTIVLLVTIAAPVAMANLCCDDQPHFLGTKPDFLGTIWTGGWPFTWYAFPVAGAPRAGVSWPCNVPRLLGNAAIWLVDRHRRDKMGRMSVDPPAVAQPAVLSSWRYWLRLATFATYGGCVHFGFADVGVALARGVIA